MTDAVIDPHIDDERLILLLVGAVGAGKGTQAAILSRELGIPHLASGNLFRAATAAGTPLGEEARGYMERGELVPDEITIGMFMEELARPRAAAGAILDGFPRTVGQAEILEDGLERRDRSLTAVLLIDASDEDVIKRLSGRRICTKNGHLYHVDFDPPKHEGVCDQDGSRLIQRDDDKPEVIQKRLDVYHEQTKPLIDWYEERSLLRRFDGSRAPSEVRDHIRASLATLKLEETL